MALGGSERRAQRGRVPCRVARGCVGSVLAICAAISMTFVFVAMYPVRREGGELDATTN
jgi:hypothetical protein